MGDDAASTDAFGQHPHIERIFAGVTPQGKTAAIAGLQADGTVAMVGDGTNDARALALADLGITLRSGTAEASDAADVGVAAMISTLPRRFDQFLAGNLLALLDARLAAGLVPLLGGLVLKRLDLFRTHQLVVGQSIVGLGQRFDLIGVDALFRDHVDEIPPSSRAAKTVSAGSSCSSVTAISRFWHSEHRGPSLYSSGTFWSSQTFPQVPQVACIPRLRFRNTSEFRWNYGWNRVGSGANRE